MASIIPLPPSEPQRQQSGRPSLGKRYSSVCVVGLGYIGLPTASILADCGYRVFGTDVRPHVVDTVNRGEIHIHEPHLDRLVRRVVEQGRLTAALEPHPADVFILCVPTPFHEDRSPDVTYVEAAARSIRPYVRPGNLVILESTSPPRTTEEIVVKEAIPESLAVGADVFVAYCPERVLPGRILIEAVENDRVVGGITAACTDRALRFYQTFVTGAVVPTNAVTAEMTKLVENSFRDVNIAFANELSMMAERFGVDVWELIELANRHPRVKILSPGPGVGGHCISVDPWFLVHTAPDLTPLIRTAREVNDRKPQVVLAQINRLAQERRAKTIGCLGLAYKADVDDLRESPSLEIVRELRRQGRYEILACEPYATPDKFSEFPVVGLDVALQRSDVLVLLTDHSHFRAIRPELLACKALLDTRGIWRPATDGSSAWQEATEPRPAQRRAA